MAPKVLIILKARWPRAFLRVQLQDRGYDAMAAADPVGALVFATAPAAPIRLILVEESVLNSPPEREAFARIRAAHPGAETVLLGNGRVDAGDGDWTATLEGQDPTEVLRMTRRLLPVGNGGAPDTD